MKPINKYQILILFILTIPVAQSVSYKKPPIDDKKSQIGYIPKDGFVPDALTAKKIAEAVWLPIYGEKILKKKPFIAKLKSGIWYVEGSLPPNLKGGVPYIEIREKDGKILKVIHGK